MKECTEADVQLCLPAFTVPKSDGGHRLIYDARVLNSMCQAPAGFEVISIPIALQNTHAGWVCGKIDLKHAFWQIGLDPDCQSLFGMKIGKRFFRWQVLPFGFSWSAVIFSAIISKILEEVSQGHPKLKLFTYLDDILVVGERADFDQRMTALVKSLTERDVILNLKKSQLVGTESTTFLGFLVYPGLHRLNIPKRKARKTRRVLRSVKAIATLHQLQSVLGKLRHLSLGVPELSAFIRKIPVWIYGRLKHLGLDPNLRTSWSTKVEVPFWIRKRFRSAANILGTTERRFCGLGQSSICILDADATPASWGACLHTKDKIQERTYWGTFQGKERPIAERELMATIFSTLAACSRIKGRAVLFRTDNQAVYWILTKGSSRNLRLNSLCLLWWSIIRVWEIAPAIQWIPTDINFLADQISRRRVWSLETNRMMPLHNPSSKDSWRVALSDFMGSCSKIFKDLQRSSIRYLKRSGSDG